MTNATTLTDRADHTPPPAPMATRVAPVPPAAPTGGATAPTAPVSVAPRETPLGLHQLTPQLKRLRLSGILDTLEVRTQQAIAEQWAYVEFLTRLVQDEVERRAHKQLDLRLRRSTVNTTKTLETFDFAFNPGVNRAQAFDLATFIVMVSRHGLGAEANPLVSDLFYAMGLPAVVAAKVALVILIGALAVASSARGRRGIWSAIGGLPLALAIAAGVIGGITNAAAYLG